MNSERDETIQTNDLIDYLARMYEKPVRMDHDALKRLSEQNWNGLVELMQACFRGGWNASVKHLLNNFRILDEEQTK